MYKILVISNGVSKDKIEVLISNYNNWLIPTLGIEAEPVILEVSEPLKFVHIGQYSGLDLGTTNKFNTEAVGCQAIVYFYDPKGEQGLANWTYLMDDRPQTQIICNPLFTLEQVGDEIRHENIHGFFANLRAKGITLIDELDTHADKSGEAFEIAKIKPFVSKLSEPLPVDTKINILFNIIKTLKQVIELYTKSNIRKWAEAMSEFEGFNIQGSVAQRNKNPLNLRWSRYQLGVRDGFAYFADVATGWKAAEFQLTIACNGTSKYYWPTMTLESFFTVYAPRYDNNQPDKYAQYVAGRLGVSVDIQIKNLL